MSAPVSVPILSNVARVRAALADLRSIEVPAAIVAELEADASRQDAAALVDEAVAHGSDTVRILFERLSTEGPTKDLIADLAKANGELVALQSLTLGPSPTVPPVSGSPFTGTHGAPVTTAQTHTRWSHDLLTYINHVIGSVPFPPALPLTDYQAECAAFEAAGRGDRPAIPRSTDADLLALKAIDEYTSDLTGDIAIITYLRTLGDQVKAGVVEPLTTLAAADELTSRIPIWTGWHATVSQLIEATNAHRAEVGL